MSRFENRIKALLEDSLDNLPMWTLKRGTHVYHGTSGEWNETEEELVGPAWVSTSSYVADEFKNWHSGPHERVLTFEVIEDVDLLEISDKEDFDQILEYFGTEDYREVAEHLPYNGWIIPTNYPNGDDIMLQTPSRHLRYVETK